jgi:transposase
MKLARNYRAGDLTAVWVPDATHEALRDLVRAREAAKRDQLRARNRLTKFLLRQEKRPPQGVTVWTLKYMDWIRKEVHFEQLAQEATLLDYLHKVEHMAARIEWLDRVIEEAVKLAPSQMREVIEALQALRGIAQVTAVTVVAERPPQPQPVLPSWSSSFPKRCFAYAGWPKAFLCPASTFTPMAQIKPKSSRPIAVTTFPLFLPRAVSFR